MHFEDPLHVLSFLGRQAGFARCEIVGSADG
jgi:hypothetical protein